MVQTQLETPRLEGTAVIRNEPVQARSAARLTALLDAAAHVVHEIGYERLTTAMVADRAGASIGTVYRYFPDRIAVLQSLAARSARPRRRGRSTARSAQASGWARPRCGPAVCARAANPSAALGLFCMRRARVTASRPEYPHEDETALPPQGLHMRYGL